MIKYSIFLIYKNINKYYILIINSKYDYTKRNYIIIKIK